MVIIERHGMGDLFDLIATSNQLANPSSSTNLIIPAPAETDFLRRMSELSRLGASSATEGGAYLRTEHFGGRPVPRCISAFRHMFVAAHHYCVLCAWGAENEE
ncbi:hypothetical protein CI102_691 [Trichoderma harzianum]|uniref:Uncharacterized protein n=1 Tax=Trichoderma harzianum CBS 226.95 TaxID=983964 RepID=A0A2T4AIE8_TRIHA|nr:hypothetical protein M431DRAFT_386861 [Trichoderma harzianum CBS 226.95]PKK54364.1 hypothetical protein CI102_691 [Trichoderma harzianum]PTB56812.1 hypothetical protein M431DRAFT_386861 [Trichoderma harzianum CBS 226.95]